MVCDALASELSCLSTQQRRCLGALGAWTTGSGIAGADAQHATPVSQASHLNLSRQRSHALPHAVKAALDCGQDLDALQLHTPLREGVTLGCAHTLVASHWIAGLLRAAGGACWVGRWSAAQTWQPQPLWPCCRQRIGAEASDELRSIEFDTLVRQLRWCAEGLFRGEGEGERAFRERCMHAGSGARVQPQMLLACFLRGPSACHALTCLACLHCLLQN